MKNFHDKYFFPAAISLFLGYIYLHEYRENGIRGILELLVISVFVCFVIFVVIWRVLDWWLRKRSS